jgi:hypothetical protein
MLGVVGVWKGGDVNWLAVSSAVVLASWCGVASGLLISTLAPSAERATAAVPAIMLPQVVLAGVLVALPDMNVLTKAASFVSAAKWANQAVEIGILNGRKVDAKLLAVSENLWPLRNLYPDYNLQAAEGRAQFLADHEGRSVDQNRLLALDYASLVLCTAIPLWGTVWALRRQDPL